jgi:two-component system, NarL family, response regulator NreC
MGLWRARRVCGAWPASHRFASFSPRTTRACAVACGFVLERDASVLVLAEAGDLATAVRHVGRFRPDVLLFDPWLLDASRIEAVRCLRAQAPGTEIVVLTMHESEAFAKQALEAGALGFVLKDTADLELPEAVRLAARGEGYTSPRVSAHVAGVQALNR